MPLLLDGQGGFDQLKGTNSVLTINKDMQLIVLTARSSKWSSKWSGSDDSMPSSLPSSSHSSDPSNCVTK